MPPSREEEKGKESVKKPSENELKNKWKEIITGIRWRLNLQFNIVERARVVLDKDEKKGGNGI